MGMSVQLRLAFAQRVLAGYGGGPGIWGHELRKCCGCLSGLFVPGVGRGKLSCRWDFLLRSGICESGRDLGQRPSKANFHSLPQCCARRSLGESRKCLLCFAAMTRRDKTSKGSHCTSAGLRGLDDPSASRFDFHAHQRVKRVSSEP